MSAAATMAAKRAARRAAGLCTECDQPAMKGHSMCRRHREMNSRRIQRFNRSRHDRNLCYCGERVAPGRSRCPTCLQLENERQKARYAELKAAGRCIQCGRRARPGRVRCLRCTGTVAEYYQNRKERRQLRLARRGQLTGRLFELHAFSVGAPARR